MVCFAVAPRKWTASGRETVLCAVKLNMRLWGRHDCSKVGGRDWNRQHVVGSLRQTHFQLNDNMWCVTEPELLQDSLFRTMEESMLYRDEINWVEREERESSFFLLLVFFFVFVYSRPIIENVTIPTLVLSGYTAKQPGGRVEERVGQ